MSKCIHVSILKKASPRLVIRYTVTAECFMQYRRAHRAGADSLSLSSFSVSGAVQFGFA